MLEASTFNELSPRVREVKDAEVNKAFIQAKASSAAREKTKATFEEVSTWRGLG